MTIWNYISILTISLIIPEIAAHLNFWIIQYGKINPDNHSDISKIWHRFQFLLRVITYFIIVMFAYRVHIDNWIQAAEIFLIFGITYWHWFDGRINQLLQEKWSYRGKTSDIDRLIYKVHWTVKIVAGIFCIFLWLDLIFNFVTK